MLGVVPGPVATTKSPLITCDQGIALVTQSLLRQTISSSILLEMVFFFQQPGSSVTRLHQKDIVTQP
jgi:hypothetical protein